MPETTWEKTKGYSKQGFDKVWHTLDKLGAPVNRLSNRVGAEAFWPMTLDKESDKAARILRSFCKDGFYADIDDETPDVDIDGKINRPKGKQRVVRKIPSKVIKQAKGLAIFTTMRTGLWLSGSGGSGVLLGRIPETGEWSPPSGIMLHTAGIGFLAGVDIYDCVVVINTYEALEAFKKVRCTLGGEISAAAGPFGVGGVLDSEVHKRRAPIWTYMKSRGLYGGVQVDGTIIIERTDENERFFGERISVTDILAGKVRHPPYETRTLIQTVKAAQGDVDVDESLVVSPGQTPGDMEIQPPNTATFGIPDADDPDPYGVKALEAEGLFIREAGTKTLPTHDVFEFKPSLDTQRRFTMSTRGTRNSWRTSLQSFTSVDRGTQTSEAAPTAPTAPTSVSRTSSVSNRGIDDRLEPCQWDDEGTRWTNVSGYPYKSDDSDDDKPDEDDLEVHVVSSATVSKHASFANSTVENQTHSPNDLKRVSVSPTFTRARLVTIPKRSLPPPLPPRNPHRTYASPSPPVSPVPWDSPGCVQSVASSESDMTKGVTSEPSRPRDSAEYHSAVDGSAADTSYDKGIVPHASATDTDGFEPVDVDSTGWEDETGETRANDAMTTPEIERVKSSVQVNS